MFVHIVMYQVGNKFIPWSIAFTSYTNANKKLAELRDKGVQCYTFSLKVEE